jgi:phosphoribosylaminoimidazole carboxylase
MLKSRRLAYDGRGNSVITSAKDVEAGLNELASKGDLYIERWVPYVRELAVLVAKGVSDEKVYDVVETIQKDSICDTVWAPAPIAAASLAAASDIALRAVRCIPSSGAGIFAVELFELADGSILFNEIAPRVHNSGHYSIEACACSQFEQHIRCVTGLPLGSTAMKVGAAAMVNIIGHGIDMAEVRYISKRVLEVPAASLHLYGKAQCRPGRKMGHITVVAETMQLVREKVAHIRNVPIFAGPSLRSPFVGIIMGSDSDLPTMSAAAHVLEKFGVSYELTIVSAHRTPQRMFEYATGARDKGLRVIIAGAGGAAHLPGMVAAITTLPVIGVPVPLAHLDGVDSLHSILQMPKGIPVATVAIGNATNAALLAIRILGATDTALAHQLEKYKDASES